MVRFVALGDSLTEGTGDPHPLCPNGLRGWADLLAAGLAAADPDSTYANLAVHGKRAHEVRRDQLEPALEMSPGLVTLWAGGNDLLRPTVQTSAVVAPIEESIAQLRAGGADVLLLTGMRPPGVPMMRALGGRIAALNDALASIARDHDAGLVDVSDAARWSARGLWAPDRVHPSSAGHLLLAEQVARVAGLGAVTDWLRRHTHDLAQPHRRGEGIAAALHDELRWWAVDVVPHFVRWATNASARECAPVKWPEPVRPSDAFGWLPRPGSMCVPPPGREPMLQSQF